MQNDSDVMGQLTAFEMSQAERTAGLSIATLEDPNFPKIDLLGALAWVYKKRSEPTLTFKAFMESHTLDQITQTLGMSDNGEEGEAGARDAVAPDAEGAG